MGDALVRRSWLAVTHWPSRRTLCMDADADAGGGEDGGEDGSTVLALDRGSQIPPMLFLCAWRCHHKRRAASERMESTPKPAERPAIKGMSAV